MDRTARAFDGLVMRADWFISEFHAKKQEASRPIDSLTHDRILQGLTDPAYQ